MCVELCSCVDRWGKAGCKAPLTAAPQCGCIMSPWSSSVSKGWDCLPAGYAHMTVLLEVDLISLIGLI